jgi:hypothetical protein
VLTLYDQLSAAGYAGRIRPVRSDGGYLYELRLEKLVTEREAQSLADKLARDCMYPRQRFVGISVARSRCFFLRVHFSPGVLPIAVGVLRRH